MIYLLLSILSSTLIVLVFKSYERMNIHTFQAIVFNYFVAAALGFMLDGASTNLLEIPAKAWFPNSIVFGIMFIVMFYLLGISTQKVGISVSTVAFKMSVVIPVVAAVFLYGDTMPFIKAAGVILACVAVYMTSIQKERKEVESKYLFLPLIIFIGSGCLDTYFKYTEVYYLDKQELEIFSSVLFFISALSGVAVLIYNFLRKNYRFQPKSLLGGLMLGIPNFGSIYFFFQALESPIQSSVIFPVNNMGIVALSALLAMAIFREKLSLLNWLGIILALISIAMIMYSEALVGGVPF